MRANQDVPVFYLPPMPLRKSGLLSQIATPQANDKTGATKFLTFCPEVRVSYPMQGKS